jgi:two-component system CheB/CheR fusion protein
MDWLLSLQELQLVITFSDITDRKVMEQQLIAEKMYSDVIIDTIRESLLIIDSDLRVISTNKSFYRSFKSTPAEIEGKLIYELENGEWDIPEFRKLLEKILPENSSYENFRIKTDSRLPESRELSINARKIVMEGVKRELILVAIEEKYLID